MSEAGGILESPSIEFGEDSDSILVENLLASVAQHQREKNGEQTKNRMRARCMNGYWVFHAPVGYKYEKVKGHGKLLVRDEPIATIVTEALEGYASGRFETFVEIKRFLDNQPDYPKGKYGEVYPSRIPELLSKPLYAGYITHERWGIHLHPAHHEGLISLETWHKIQQRMTADGDRRTLETAPVQPIAPIRKDTRPEFPLRGFVTCASCEKPMTAAWSKGRSAKYGYYFCQTRGCEERRKNIRKETIEEDFEVLLRGIQPRREAYEVMHAMLKDLWDDRRTRAASLAKKAMKDLEQLDRKASQVMERLLATSTPALIAAYEGEIQKIGEQKLVLSEKSQNTPENLKPFEETYRTALEFLVNPW